MPHVHEARRCRIGHQSARSDEDIKTDQRHFVTICGGDDHIARPDVEAVRQNDQAAPTFTCLSGEDLLDRRSVAHWSKRYRYAKRRGRLDLASQRGERRGVRIENGCDSDDSWRDLFEQLYPFSDDRRVERDGRRKL
jgi:hypothetical protein